MSETYIGDGLYVSLEADVIKLRAPRFEGDHIVYLEPFVLTAFLEFLEKTRPEREKWVRKHEDKMIESRRG